MVAITVILAAVIGAFVLEIGDQQETAPNASFDTDERVVTIASARSDPMEINTSQVIFTHAGGETLPIDRLELSIEGYRDVWGVTPTANALEKTDGPVSDSVDVAPQPDWRRGAGTNQPAELASGESWNAIAFNVHKTSNGESQKSLYEPGRFDADPPAAETNHDYIFQSSFYTTEWANQGYGPYQCDCVVLYFWADSEIDPSTKSYGDHYGWGQQLVQGQTADIVWEAESGGKTQTLTSYTFQHIPTKDRAYD
jgi:hypothetical protein